MKITPSTARRIGAMLLAKKVTTPSVSMPLLGWGAARVACSSAVTACGATPRGGVRFGVNRLTRGLYRAMLTEGHGDLPKTQASAQW